MNKGDVGYLKDVKKRELIKCIVQWGLVIAFLIIGIIIFETKLNILTMVAVLGCLPASKAMVAVVVKWPIKPLDKEKVDRVVNNTNYLTSSFDVVLTSKEKIMPLQCVVIAGNTIYAYTNSKKVGLQSTANYMKAFLKQNEIDHLNIKIFDEFVPFVSRVEGLNNIASIEQNDTKEREETIKNIMKLYSM